MNPLAGRQEPSSSSSLDNKYTSARKRYRRTFHRVMSGLSKSGSYRLLTLTSSPSSGDFQRDFRKLYMRLQRRHLVNAYIRVPENTKSGLRHDHILFRGSYIEQVWISKLWAGIHNAPIVDIRKVSNKRAMAGYLGHYMAKSPIARHSYSWTWVWRGFVKSWEALKKFAREYGQPFNETLTFWEWCIKLGKKPEEVLPYEV